VSRDARINLRATQEQYDRISEAAAKSGESVSSYLIRRGLEDDSKLALEIRKVLKKAGA